jgi:hypothetical protein
MAVKVRSLIHQAHAIIDDWPVGMNESDETRVELEEELSTALTFTDRLIGESTCERVEEERIKERTMCPCGVGHKQGECTWDYNPPTPGDKQ